MPVKYENEAEAANLDSVGDDAKDSKATNTDHTTDPVIWEQRFELAYNNQKKMFKKWAEYYEMMYAIKTYKNIGVWRSKMFIPVMSYKVWTIVAKLLAMRPGFSVKVYDKIYSEADRDRIEKANAKLEHDYDNPMLDESIRDRLFDSLSDAVICGTGFGMAPWTTGTRNIYNHTKNDDGTINYNKSQKTEIEYGYNDLQPINSFDVFAAPGKRNFQQKPWIIVKYASKSRVDLLNSGMYDKATIENLQPLGKTKDEVARYKQSRNQLIGKGNDDQDGIDETVDTFDIFECLERTTDGIYLCTFAEVSGARPDNGEGKPAKQSASNDNSHWEKIRSERQPYWHNKYPLIPFYIRRRPHDAWGESIFEVTESMANGYNDIVNQFADNLNIVGNGGILMHNTSTTIYDFYYAPGGEVRYAGEKPEFETPDSPDINLFTTMLNLLDGAISNSTISPYASGTPADATDKTQGTAEGITKLQEAAGELITFLKSNFMQSLKSLGQMWLSNNRQFMDEDIMLETQKGGKRMPMKVGSQDFIETMVLTIDEQSMQPATKEERLTNAKSWVTDMFTIQDRSFVQAGLKPAEATGEPVPGTTDMPQIDPTTGQPAVDEMGQPIVTPAENPQKPIFFDLERIAQWLSEEYGYSEFDQFVSGDKQTDPSQNADVVSAIRTLVDSGDIEQDVAQAIIDQVEGRSSNYVPEQDEAPEGLIPTGESDVTAEPLNAAA